MYLQLFWIYDINICGLIVVYYIFRPLASGQRGEVYEVNGDRVAVILDFTCDSNANVERDEKVKEEPAKAPVYWIDGNLIYFICEWVQSIVFNCMQI